MTAFAVLRGLLMLPVGAMGPFWPGDSSVWAVGGGGLVGCVWDWGLSARMGCAVSKVGSSARALRFP